MAASIFFGVPSDFGAPDLVDGSSGLLSVEALPPAESIRIDLGGEPGETVSDWSIAVDILVPPPEGNFTALLQTDPTNGSDGDLFLRSGDDGLTAGIGISGQYDGSYAYGTWARIVFTVDFDDATGESLLSKYIDGVKVGTQAVDGARFTLDAAEGALLFSDEDGETNDLGVSSVAILREVLSDEDVAALGGADANGILDEGRDGATQWDFEDGDLTPSFGTDALIPSGLEPEEEGPIELVAEIAESIVTRDAADRVIDLSQVFAGEGLSFAVSTSDADIAGVELNGASLSIEFGDTLGFSDIAVTATDADGNTLTDRFRVRVAGEGAYTIAVLPDTQDYASNPALAPQFGEMTQWLVDNRDGRDLSFVIHVGDVTNGNSAREWEVAEAAMRRFDGLVPYSLLPGNHDQSQGGSAAAFDQDSLSEYFPVAEQAALPGWGGVYEGDPDTAWNRYHTFEAPDGTKWLVLALEFGARDEVIEWADGVIADHLDHRVILSNHSYMNYESRHSPLGGPLNAEGAGYDYGIGRDPRGANDGETMWRDLLRKYPNVAFTFSGHIFGDGAETLLSHGDQGNAVHQMLVNYQRGVSAEHPGNGDTDASPDGGQNGTFRMLVIDPENGTVSTETYIEGLDQYVTNPRDSETLDRDGLTGPYRGVQETLDVDLGGAPELHAIADAGFDQEVGLAGAETFAVMLDASATLDPEDEATDFAWTDWEGELVATGEAPAVELGAGVHDLTLTVFGSDGAESSDQTRVIVSGPDTLLVETFDDGDIAGWQAVAGRSAFEATVFGTASSLGLPALPGGDAAVMGFAKLPPDQSYRVAFDDGAPAGGYGTWTAVFDLLVPQPSNSFTSLLQLDLNNGSDGELFIRNNGNGTGGIGIGGNYPGEFIYGQWHRVAFTVTPDGAGAATLARYIDGALVGTSTVDATRFTVDAQGLLLFTDEDNETNPGFVSSFAFVDEALDAEAIGALGGPDANGIFADAPSPGSLQLDFEEGSRLATFGGATLTGDGFGPDLQWGDVTEFGRPELPGEGDQAALELPAFNPDAGLLVKPEFETVSGDLTLILDLYIPRGQEFISLLQQDLNNAVDGSLFLVERSNGFGTIGTNGVDQGEYVFDAWQRVALVYDDLANGDILLSKYIEGEFVGSQTLDSNDSAFDFANGFYLNADDGGETTELTLAGLVVSDVAFTAEQIAALGGASAGPILGDPPSADTTEWTFEAGDLTASSGPGQLSLWQRETVDAGPWFIRGTVNSTAEQADPAGALYERSAEENNLIVYRGEGAEAWTDVAIDATLRSADRGTVGIAFRVEADDTFYLAEFDIGASQHRLVKVVDGVREVLAEQAGHTPFNRDFDVRIVAVGDAFSVSLDGADLFGVVTDDAPLASGTIGGWSSEQRQTWIDDVVVNRATADDLLVAPEPERPVPAHRVLGSDLALDTFTIVDEGEDSPDADWREEGGSIVQSADVTSRQLTGTNADASDPWLRGWSPLGDGAYVLRLGTYAVYGGEGAGELEDYAVETSVRSDAGGSVGLLLNWQDADNYVKFELDAANDLHRLIVKQDGIEQIVQQGYGAFDPGAVHELRVEVVDQAFQAFVDGVSVFETAVEDRRIEGGTFALYSWDSPGAVFDDVTLIDLAPLTLGDIRFPETEAGRVEEQVSLTEGVELVGKRWTVVENTGDWNDVRRAMLHTGVLEDGLDGPVLFGNILSVGFDATRETAPVDVALIGVKRGQVKGSELGDDVLIVAHGNHVGGDGCNTVRLWGNGGDDRIEVRAVISSQLDNVLLADDGNGTNGPYNLRYAGAYTVAEIQGGDGNDTIFVFDRVRAVIDAGAGDDLIQTRAGNDTVWGGVGFDTVQYVGTQEGYEVTLLADGSVRVVDTYDVDGITGTDTLTGVERLRFGDGSVFDL